MFAQRHTVLLAAGLLTAALCSPASSGENATAGLAPSPTPTASAQPGVTAGAQSPAVETATQITGIGIEEPTRDFETLAKRIAVRAPIETEPPLILGVRF